MIVESDMLVSFTPQIIQKDQFIKATKRFILHIQLNY